MLLYNYVGPKEIVDRVRNATSGVGVINVDDILQWARQTQQAPDRLGNITATFVIDETGSLRIADRRSEHVACAGGKAVCSAGEFTFHISGKKVHVSQVSNQSTGYCPEPESWPAVETALRNADIPAPAGFEPVFIFRRCEHCGSTNIVKDDDFECAVCSLPLPEHWNFQPMPAAARSPR